MSRDSYPDYDPVTRRHAGIGRRHTRRVMGHHARRRPTGLAGIVLRLGVALLVLLLVGAVVGLIALDRAYSGRILANVSVQGLDLSKLRSDEARAALRQRYGTFLATPITFQFANRTWQPTPEQLGVSLEIDADVARAYAVGRGANLLRALRWSALTAVAVACGALLLGVRDGLPLLYLSLGAFAAGTNLVMIVRTLRGGWLRIGGYLAHVGMVVFIAGVIGSTTYASPEQKLVLPEGEMIRAYGYDFTFNGWRVTPDNKGVLDLTVMRDGAPFQALPQLYYIPRRGATLLTPAIKRELLRDLYITPVSYQQPVDRNAADFGFNDTRAIGPYTITFLGFDVADLRGSDAGAKLRVQYQGATIELTPRAQLSAGADEPPRSIQPLQLPGGQTLALENIDPVRRMARVRVNGLNLPVDPGLAVVTISLKPGIALVWLGVVIGVVGGLVALLRRTIEGRARLAGQPARLPRSLSGLAGLVGSSARQQPVK